MDISGDELLRQYNDALSRLAAKAEQVADLQSQIETLTASQEEHERDRVRLEEAVFQARRVEDLATARLAEVTRERDKALQIASLEMRAVDRRPLCPDCRDKVSAEDQCLRCRYQLAEARLEAAERQLAAGGRSEGRATWQPISSAPKDRSWFLGWNSDCGAFVWRDGPGLLTGEDPAPTHWMPLPKAPSASREDQ